MRDAYLEVYIPRSSNTWDGTANEWVRNDPNRYQQKTVGTNVGKCLLHDSTIDLSAFFVQDKTFFPYELVTQIVGLVECGATSSLWNDAASVQILDIITSVPINQQDLVDAIVENKFPGFPEFPLDMQYIVYGNLKTYAANSTNSIPGYMQMMSSQNFGAGKPTAADKLYVYHVIIPDSDAPITNNATLETPAIRYQLLGKTDNEDELDRVYRLRQSYEQLERA